MNHWQGTYAVADKKTYKLLYSSINKGEALREATKFIKAGQNVGVWFMWNHNILKNFNRDILGKIPLDTLYKERAQQLRDKYDELILYYSGGSDSHNILQTFLRNNIKLDYIFVRWPFKMLDKGLYTANNQDRSASNFVSEWDFVLKHDLDYIKSKHPEIKIIVSDWLEDIDISKYNDDLFLRQNHFHSAVNFLRMASHSDTEIQLLNKGKKVAAIWGIDKPSIFIDSDNKAYFVLLDLAFQHSTPVLKDNNNIECFYTTPDMPELAYEMAYQVFLYFKARPELRPMLNDKSQYDAVNDIIKTICYSYWDNNKFQANKPKGFRKDKDFWFYDNKEFAPIIDRWQHYYKSQLDDIDKSFLSFNKEGVADTYNVIYSPQYYIGDMD